MGEQNVRRYAPLLVAVLVLGVIGAVWAASRGGGASTGPGSGGATAPLRLVGWTPADAAPDPRYSLAEGADLPEGPGTATVRAVEAAGAGELRAALAGLARTLTVEESGRWTTGTLSCVSGIVADGAAAATSSQPAPPPPPDPAPDLAMSTGCDPAGAELPPGDRPTLATLLAAVGLDGDAVGDVGGVPQTDGVDRFSIDPIVGGLPTDGLRTTVLATDDRVVSGDGWVVRTPPMADYPVVSAPEAYQLLRRTPLPMPLMACPEPLPEGADPVPCGLPVTVARAELGLSLQQSADGHLLVPAWFFTVRGSAHPLVQLAVEPRLLEPAEPTGGGTGGSPGTGTAVPPAPTDVPPSTGPGEPVPDPQSRFIAVSRGADDTTLDVTFWGGVAACYSYDVRVVEDETSVRIWLLQKGPQGAKVCIDIAQERHETVTLQRPLGLRTVEDGDTGKVLLGPRR